MNTDDDPFKPSTPPSPLGTHCREIAGTAVQTLLRLVDEIAINGKVDQREIHKIAQAILAAEGPLADAYGLREHKCSYAFHRADIDCKRTDVLGRLIIKPLESLLDDPQGLERKRVGQFLTAIRMLVGEEEHEDLRHQAAELADFHRGADGIVDWDQFYTDTTGAWILEQVLVALANRFKRFDPRRDWFLVMMNATPSSVSIASNAFVQLKSEDRAQFAFTEAHMAVVFETLFANYHLDAFTSNRLRAFTKHWKQEPDKIFGHLLVEIARMRQQFG